MKKKTSLMVVSMLLCVGSFAGAETVSAPVAVAVQRALNEQIALAEQQNKLAAQLDIHTASMQWKRCEVLQYRQRRAAVLSKAGNKQVTTGCETVVTHCNAVTKAGHVFVSAACFYPSQNKNQTTQLLQARLLTAGGDTQALSFLTVLKDFVILANE